MTTIAIETTAFFAAVTGTEVFIPLNKLKKHPNNARKTPHSEASIEAKAASIHAKGILQNLVWSRSLTLREPRPTSISSASVKAEGWRSCCV